MNNLKDIQEYQRAVKYGFEPLLDWRKFTLPIRLRVELQRQLFGHCTLTKADNIARANERFYRWVFEHKTQVCEETGKPLYDYSAIHVSHILTKGSHPEMSHDPRNTNLLTAEAHELWENGDRKGMKIYPLNLIIIELLKSDYSNL